MRFLQETGLAIESIQLDVRHGNGTNECRCMKGLLGRRPETVKELKALEGPRVARCREWGDALSGAGESAGSLPKTCCEGAYRMPRHLERHEVGPCKAELVKVSVNHRGVEFWAMGVYQVRLSRPQGDWHRGRSVQQGYSCELVEGTCDVPPS